MEGRWRELPFWQLEYRRVEGEPLVRLMWGALLLGALALGLTGLLGLTLKRGYAAPYLTLAALVIAHLIARSLLEQRLPNPSFLNDLRTGNLDQFRLLDLSPHALLLQRGLPALFYRLPAHCLWLPLYGAWGAWMGIPPLESGLLWLLFAFADPLVLILLGFYLALSILGIWEPLTLALLVFGYGSLREIERMRFGSASSWVFGLLIGGSILLRLLLPMSWMYTLPDTSRFALVWLLTESLRWERRARWLHAPSGLWRYWWLLPAAGMMAMPFPLVWEWTPTWSNAQRFQAAAVLLFLMAGWQQMLLLTVVRGRDPVQQGWRAHLKEVALARALSALVLLLAAKSYGVSGTGPAFWLVWLTLTVADIPLSAFYRSMLQRAWCMRIRLNRLAVLELLPISWFVLAPDRYVVLGVLNPLVALTAFTPLWGLTVRPPPPPAWVLIALPLLWRLGMLAVAYLLTRSAIRAWEWRPLPAWLQTLLAPVLLYPLHDWLHRRMTSNPVTHFFASERRFDPAPLLTGLGWLVGLVLPPPAAIGWGILIFPVMMVSLWLGGYRIASQRVQKLVETGELRQWFLTGLNPLNIYWGLVFSVWHWQLRLLVALFGCGALAVWIRSLYDALHSPPSPALPIMMVFTGGMVTMTWLSVMVVVCSQLFLAAPVAIQDTLSALGRRERPSMARATLLSLLYTGCAVTGCMLAPLLLIGLPIYSSRSERTLRQIARAPDEYLQRLPAPVR